MSYWRAYDLGDELLIMAVGTTVFGSSSVLPPRDGLPYLRPEELAEVKRKWKPRPKVKFPWQAK